MQQLRLFLFICTLSLTWLVQAQESLWQEKKFAVRDSIQIDSLSIQSSLFKIQSLNGDEIPSSQYDVDFSKAILRLSSDIKTDSILVSYLRYPNFLTQKYESEYRIIDQDNEAMQRLLVLEKPNIEKDYTPFDGLETYGSLSRGVRVGNSQNAVLNSELDLQISGKISDDISIRASIQDNNLPTQQGSYSQTLDEFDQIFIELYHKDWFVRAGDVDIGNNKRYFSSFQKKIQGISGAIKLESENGSETEIYASGALVKGVFHRNEFKGVDGNQGPYKLKGPNGELYVLIVSGSERVFVNGIILERGENKDYQIDYNAGEIRFNPSYPITSNMRISVEYQFTERSYTRYLVNTGVTHETTKGLSLGLDIYSEQDSKNRSLQQNLSPEQVQILKDAGNDKEAMFAPSAVEDSYSENKILYRKVTVNGEEIFEFSNDPNETLYQVKFTYVGPNQGDYIVEEQTAIAKIFAYRSPIAGIKQGDYEAKIQLTAPEMLQVITAYADYKPKEDQHYFAELALSHYDQNLFSKIDNSENIGYASKIGIYQPLVRFSDTNKIRVFADLDYIEERFQSIQEIYQSEFNRDWNLQEVSGTQHLLLSGVEWLQSKGQIRYSWEKLSFQGSFQGNRHQLQAQHRSEKWQNDSRASIMESKADTLSTKFIKAYQHTNYSLDKAWVGAKFSLERNEQENTETRKLNALSHQYAMADFYIGIGDSLNRFVQVGYKTQVNDSLVNEKLAKVNQAHNYYIKSKLIQTDQAQLSAYANFRELKYKSAAQENQKNLNAQIQYQQNFLKNNINLNIHLESNSGVLAQQEFTYIKVEPGQGVYKWVDYNDNGIQELDEFEIAEFPDEAEYIRVLLPNQHYVQVNESKFSQTLSMQIREWKDLDSWKGLIGKLYNQSSYLVDRKVAKDGSSFHFNPFKDAGDEQMGLHLNFRNSLFFNRGLQRYTTNYTYMKSENQYLQVFGLQKNILESHQLRFQHKVQEQWVLHQFLSKGKNSSSSTNFENRNYNLKQYELEPKISYVPGFNTSIDLYYNYTNKENSIGARESLKHHKLGVSAHYANKQSFSIYGEFNYINNKFEGDSFSAVAYQMLEALQPGTNYTWSLRFQKKLTKYLDLNFDYQARKSENTSLIHTGNIQLKAYL